MAHDQVAANLEGMDDLDFTGWNNADWHGVFAHHHTDDVYVDWKGQEPTRGVDEHIEAMKSYVDSAGAPRPRSSPTRSSSGLGTGPASSESSRAGAGW
ncbi:MAG: hypothetical protein R2736_17240 [Solirubrobacterales bacterium]